MRRRAWFFVGVVLVCLFLLYSLWFGWPGADSGWASAKDAKPIWFPSFFGGFISTGGALCAFYLIHRWR